MAKRSVVRGPTHVCSDEFGVTEVRSIGGERHSTRTTPCQECPWRKDVPVGVFPPEAFRHSAPTAYDMADRTFGCHMSGEQKPATCAGFLLRHADNNLLVRLSLMSGRINLDAVSDGGYPVYDSYTEMAVANGVAADDPVLGPVRRNGEFKTPTARLDR